MNENESKLYNIKEYAIENVSNRCTFKPHTYSQTLTGKAESFHSLYLHSSAIEKHAEANLALKGKRTVQGYKLPLWANNLIIDIDVADNLQRALEIARILVERFEQTFQVPLSTLHIKFSGNKGFHIELPSALFGGFAPSLDLPALQAAIVCQLTDGFEDCIDLGIYYHVSLVRIENTKHSKSGLFSIPLTISELRTLSINDIKTLAQQPRASTTVPTSVSLVHCLVQLKEECQIGINRSFVTPFESTSTGKAVPPDSKKIKTVFKHCHKLAEIKSKSDNKELIGHDERINLGCVLSAFGRDGINHIHELLKDQVNYDQEKTNYYLNTMAQNAYKPSLCLKICGPANLCEAIKAIRRKSPIAFSYTYDPDIDEVQKKFIESFVVDKVASHLPEILYSVRYRSFYKYGTGVYVPLQDEDLKSEMENLLPYYVPKKLITNAAMNGVVERLKLQKIIRYEADFDSVPLTLNLKNGLFSLSSGELHPHTPEFKSRIQLPIMYDAKATCPTFKRFLEEVFNNDGGMIDYILKMMAYFLIPSYSFHKVFVWYGIGRNGKGRLARVVENLLGHENIAHEDIHDLASGHFASINLLGKLVNFSTELKTNELDMAEIKKLSGGDLISADVKYKNAITFENKARLVILANELPRFSEVGQAVMQRFEFIRFAKSFIGKDADTSLDEKLLSELPGIFNLVVSKVADIMNDEAIQFDTPTSMRETRNELTSEFSTVGEFVREVYIKDNTGQLPLSGFYDQYKLWALQNGYKPVGKNNLGRTLRELLNLRVENSPVYNNQVYIYGIVQKQGWH